jgi:hypothetical protein
LNESLDSTVGILIVCRRRLFDTLDFLLRCSDIGGNGVFGDHDGGGCVVAPSDRITQLSSMILYRFGGSLDSSSSGFGSVA